jgi:hypothetical protein
MFDGGLAARRRPRENFHLDAVIGERGRKRADVDIHAPRITGTRLLKRRGVKRQERNSSDQGHGCPSEPWWFI